MQHQLYARTAPLAEPHINGQHGAFGRDVTSSPLPALDSLHVLGLGCEDSSYTLRKASRRHRAPSAIHEGAGAGRAHPPLPDEAPVAGQRAGQGLCCLEAAGGWTAVRRLERLPVLEQALHGDTIMTYLMRCPDVLYSIAATSLIGQVAAGTAR